MIDNNMAFTLYLYFTLNTNLYHNKDNKDSLTIISTISIKSQVYKSYSRRKQDIKIFVRMCEFAYPDVVLTLIVVLML